MLRLLVSATFLLVAAAQAAAHFVFVVPEGTGGARAAVILSETLEPDDGVDVAPLGRTSLLLRHADGREAPIPLGTAAEDAYHVDLPGEGQRLVRGSLVFGVQQRGK